MSEQVDDFLLHYGVPGMKWGKRKREDTGGGDRSSRTERRDARRETKATKIQKKVTGLDTKISDIDAQINALPSRFSTSYRRQGLVDMRNETVKERDRFAKDVTAAKEGKLTSTQKRVIIGASIVAGLAATYIIQDNIQSGNATRLIAKGKERITGEQFKFNKKPSLSNKDFDVDDINTHVLKHINPEYGAIGTKMNCRRATFSYEMRRRGYDVKATRTTNANGQNVLGLKNALSPNEKIVRTSTANVIRSNVKEIAKSTLDPKVPTPIKDLSKFSAGGKNEIKMPSGIKSIYDSLGKEPDGSRGELGVMWQMGGGHSMAYEIVKGKPVIFDGQTGKIFADHDLFSSTMPSVAKAGFTRLDNIDLNVDYLMRWMTNA